MLSKLVLFVALGIVNIAFIGAWVRAGKRRVVHERPTYSSLARPGDYVVVDIGVESAILVRTSCAGSPTVLLSKNGLI